LAQEDHIRDLKKMLNQNLSQKELAELQIKEKLAEANEKFE
jgi:hypothetical protein